MGEEARAAVAARKDGVDLNLLYWLFSLVMASSLPVRAVWI